MSRGSNINSNNNKINDPSIKKLFEGRNFVFVSTLMKDGTPHITPTWVDIDRNKMVGVYSLTLQ